MFSMEKFGQWLLDELEKREMSQSDLARRSGLSQGTISNMISSTRGVGPDSLRAIAKALRLPIEQVYRAANLLPPPPDVDEEMEQILNEFDNLSKQDQQEVLAFIHMKQNLRKQKR